MATDTHAWDELCKIRTQPLWEKFPGHYRALVVETNDPLNMYRIKFKCPDMHDFDLTAAQCPWAVPSPELGGKRAGRFVHPVIGDWVWITFERQHPYGPIWVGFANPTRRKIYTYPQIYSKTPVSVNETGQPETAPEDYDKDYLPKDGRPMAHGWSDRYGNLELHSSVGFYPTEHKEPPPPPEHDAIQGADFKQQSLKPEVNSPDKKYMARVTKYGHIFIMGDQGYQWKKDDATQVGEFYGDFAKDEEYETKRWLSLQKLLNDNVPNAADKDGDQRKQLMLTRYGHRIEMRDVGWAQKGPVESMSRPGEYGPPRILSNEETNDYRWIKLRTKGGMLFQMYDKGFNPKDDKFVSRNLIEESGVKSEQEDKYWGDRDARWVRIITRYGIKMVLDDRGSSPTDATNLEDPRGIGVLLKGRRSPASKQRTITGNPRGFFWEFNERDDANQTMWGSPLGQTMEINDRYQYIILASSLGTGWVPKWQGIKDNEFVLKPAMLVNPERNSHHLKIDHDNEYIRFKTRANKGARPDAPANPSGVRANELNQGVEARDGSKGNGPWVEIVDSQNRGMWFSKQRQLGIWRGSTNRQMYQWIDDRQRKIVIYNNEANGVVEIYANTQVNVITNDSINLRADKNIFIRAGNTIQMQAAGTLFTLSDGNIQTNATFNGPKVNAFICGVFPGPGGGCPNSGGSQVMRIPQPSPPGQRSPTDRGLTYNKPYEPAKPVQ
jgi:hypothetical protein